MEEKMAKLQCTHLDEIRDVKPSAKHFHQTKHPIMRSIEPREDWGWCYVDEVELDFS
jgi:hypothetical protein